MTRSNAIRTALAAAPVALFALTSAAHAQTNLAVWNFNDGPTTSPTGQAFGAAARTALFAADGGVFASTSNITTNFATADGTQGGTTGINTFTGTTENAVGTTAAGMDLGLQASNATSPSTSTPNNGRYIQFNTSTTGYNNLVFSFAARASGTGFSNNTFQYSTDGTNFTNFATFPALTSTYDTVTFDLSTGSVATALNNKSNVYFRFLVNGATSASGNVRIDNVQFNGTAVNAGGNVAPEPASIALMGLGLVGGVVARRRRNK